MAPNVWNVVNILLGAAILVIGCILPIGGSLSNVYFCSVIGLLGLSLILVEVRVCNFIPKYLPFLSKWLGVGLMLMFVGALMFSGSGYRDKSCSKSDCFCLSLDPILFCSAACVIMGVAYCVFHCINIPRPGPMSGSMEGCDPGSCQGCCGYIQGCSIPPVLINVIMIIIGLLAAFPALADMDLRGCFTGIVLRSFNLFFALIIIFREIVWPQIMTTYIGWMEDFFGEGVFLVFVSLLSWSYSDWWNRYLMTGIGIFFIVLHFFNILARPAPLLSSSRADTSSHYRRGP